MTSTCCLRSVKSLVFIFLFVTSSAPSANGELIPKLQLSSPAQIAEDMALVPCRNEERLAGVRRLFEKVGAPPADITVEEFKHVVNLVVRKPGNAEGVIVIGAHYDKTPLGCGAVDNWSGVVALAHVYRSLRNTPLNKTLVFVAFGKEENGLLGSKAMVKAIKKAQRREYCAMINLDSFGTGIPQVQENISSKKLTAMTEEIATRMKIPFNKGAFYQGSTDSVPFRKKIPVVALHGIGGNPFQILHTSKDQLSEINPASVYLGYRLALALVVQIENRSCDAFR